MLLGLKGGNPLFCQGGASFDLLLPALYQIRASYTSLHTPCISIVYSLALVHLNIVHFICVQSSRKELVADVEELKAKIAGAAERDD